MVENTMEKYRYLKEHFFDETASKRLSQYADSGKADIHLGEFTLQGWFIPYLILPCLLNLKSIFFICSSMPLWICVLPFTRIEKAMTPILCF